MSLTIGFDVDRFVTDETRERIAQAVIDFYALAVREFDAKYGTDLEHTRDSLLYEKMFHLVIDNIIFGTIFNDSNLGNYIIITGGDA